VRVDLKVNTLGILLGLLAGLFLGNVKARAEAGYASYYGGRHHGGPTASGERFNQAAATCAHPSQPIGSRLLVTNRRGRSWECRVNDRGPFRRGRIIDLSVAGAVALGFVHTGVAWVSVERLK
jgi:rare lipoprotein A